MKVRLNILTIIVGVLVAINVYFIFALPSKSPAAFVGDNHFVNTTRAYVMPISQPNYLPILNTSITRPMIDGKAALVLDVSSGRYLYSKNFREQLPVASLTKIITAMVVQDMILADEIVTVPKEAIRVDGERQGLYADEQILAGDLVKMMLVESSNDAAYALASHLNQKTGIDFVAKMNEKAVEIGMTNSRFLDPAGLNDNAYSTAEDMVKAVRYGLRYKSIWDASREQSLIIQSTDGKIEHIINNTDRLLGVVNNIIGGKTGYTDMALGCMILVTSVPGEDDKIITVVLGSNDRFSDTQKLIDWVTAAYKW